MELASLKFKFNKASYIGSGKTPWGRRLDLLVRFAVRTMLSTRASKFAGKKDVQERAEV
jgi:hypothetical protein